MTKEPFQESVHTGLSKQVAPVQEANKKLSVLHIYSDIVLEYVRENQSYAYQCCCVGAVDETVPTLLLGSLLNAFQMS